VRPNTVATGAQNYEGNVFLSKINGAEMQSFFQETAEDTLEVIADHNADPRNARDLWNCQHFVTEIAEAYEIPRVREKMRVALT